jgi:hypothetical protein
MAASAITDISPNLNPNNVVFFRFGIQVRDTKVVLICSKLAANRNCGMT